MKKRPLHSACFRWPHKESGQPHWLTEKNRAYCMPFWLCFRLHKARGSGKSCGRAGKHENSGRLALPPGRLFPGRQAQAPGRSRPVPDSQDKEPEWGKQPGQAGSGDRACPRHLLPVVTQPAAATPGAGGTAAAWETGQSRLRRRWEPIGRGLCLCWLRLLLASPGCVLHRRGARSYRIPSATKNDERCKQNNEPAVPQRSVGSLPDPYPFFAEAHQDSSPESRFSQGGRRSL